MKNLGTPPDGVVLVARVMMILLGDKINPKDGRDAVWKKA